MPQGPVVVKIGGSTLGSEDTTLADVVALQRRGIKVVVVHGGGSIISQWMERQGTVPRFVKGLRVTDGQSLEIVTAVLTGLVNKGLVASVQSMGGKALGLSGVDGGLLESEVADEALGYVGTVTKVNPDLIFQALDGGYVPMIAPLGLHEADDSQYSGSLLNVNADTVAGEIAHAIGADRLVFLTDVEGVMDGSGRVIHRLNERSAKLLLSSGVVKGGMIPKLQACLRALETVPDTCILDGRKPGALAACVDGGYAGTYVTARARG